MNYNEALYKNALLADLREIKNIPAKAMTEILLLRVHYGKIAGEWEDAKKKISEDTEASEEAKKKAIEEKAVEAVTAADRRMSKEAFEQLVATAMPLGSILSVFVLDKSKAEDAPDRRGSIDIMEWLTTFAANLVEV